MPLTHFESIRHHPPDACNHYNEAVKQERQDGEVDDPPLGVVGNGQEVAEGNEEEREAQATGDCPLHDDPPNPSPGLRGPLQEHSPQPP